MLLYLIRLLEEIGAVAVADEAAAHQKNDLVPVKFGSLVEILPSKSMNELQYDLTTLHVYKVSEVAEITR